jgi:diguanylate cyclase (GGDEF)-like protein/PAS domain S-box-containing protein
MDGGLGVKRVIIVWLILIGIVMLGPVAQANNRLVVVGDDHAYPPFAFLDQDGQPSGFSIDLICAVADVLGWELQIELGSWAEIKDKLHTGELDLITGMFYSSARTQDFAFTTRHSVASGDVFTRLDTKISSLEELRGRRVVVQEDDIVHEYLAEQNLDLDFVPVANVAQALRLIASGEEDFAAVLLIPGHYAIHEYSLNNVRSNNLQIAPSDYCFAVKKDNIVLRLMLDEGLRIVKATGKYDEIYATWLGVWEQQQERDWQRRTKALMISSAVAVVVLVWSLILQYLVRLRTADLTRANARLTTSREDLFYANEELRATIQQLTATTNQLVDQYEQLQLMEEALSEEKDLLRTTLLSVGEGIVVTDYSGRVVMINPVAQNLTGWPNRTALGHFYHEIFPGEHARVVEQVIYTEQTIEIEELTLKVGDEESIVACTIAPIQDLNEVVRGSVAVIRDISEATRQRREIEYLSFHDPLTGLYNRRGFSRELERCDQLSSLPLAVIVGDVNGLKLINDAFGHACGDELLVKVAKVLQSAVGDSGIVARLGGDEFAVVLSNTNLEVAQGKIRELKHRAQRETVQSVQISIAFGVAVKTQLDQSLQDCFNLAEEHMYQDKLKWKGS